jgi:multicomponent Na+:H+ antiporter subunit D
LKPETILLIALAAPAARALAALAVARPSWLRDSLNIALAVVQAIAPLLLLREVERGEVAPIVLARPMPDIAFIFALEPVGVIVASSCGVLSAAHAIHTAAYARMTREPAPARLQAFIALASLMASGIAFSGNLLTLFVLQQALILASLPLVEHAGGEPARRAGRVYLSMLLAAAFGLLFPAIVWTYALSGDLTFRAGGLLAGRASPIVANVLLILFAFGYATTALPPLHRWLAAASVAPFPAIGAIHALAVVPAGCVALLKTTLYVFGPAMTDAAFAARVLLLLASATMCVGALNALSKQDIRERLAYSTIAQAGGVIAGAMLATPAATYAAVLQVVALCCATLSLVMAFANVHAVTGRTGVPEMEGLGRLMPWTFSAVAIGAVSLIGLPPLAGAWPKLWLMEASAELAFARSDVAGAVFSELARGRFNALSAVATSLAWLAAGGLVALSTIATFAYLAPLAAKTLVGEPPPQVWRHPDGASFLLVTPVVAAGVGTLALIVLVDPLYDFLLPLFSSP